MFAVGLQKINVFHCDNHCGRYYPKCIVSHATYFYNDAFVILTICCLVSNKRFNYDSACFIGILVMLRFVMNEGILGNVSATCLLRRNVEEEKMVKTSALRCIMSRTYNHLFD